jgi:hypothetical protein
MQSSLSQSSYLIVKLQMNVYPDDPHGHDGTDLGSLGRLIRDVWQTKRFAVLFFIVSCTFILQVLFSSPLTQLALPGLDFGMVITNMHSTQVLKVYFSKRAITFLPSYSLPPASLAWVGDGTWGLLPSATLSGPLTYYVMPVWCAGCVAAESLRSRVATVGMPRTSGVELVSQAIVYGLPLYPIIGISGVFAVFPQEPSPLFCVPWIVLGGFQAMSGVSLGQIFGRSPRLAVGASVIFSVLWTAFQLTIASHQSIVSPDTALMLMGGGATVSMSVAALFFKTPNAAA